MFCALLVPSETLSATHYVDQASRNPRAPYPGWATAAVTIQEN